MNTLSERATVLVHSCDSYEDVWDPFFTLLNRYWPDCPFEIVINTESKSYSRAEKWNNLRIRTLNLYESRKTIPYGKRVKDHCREIKSEYIVTLMDDFFIRSPVDTKAITRILDWMDTDKRIGCVSLIHHYDKHNVRYLCTEKKLEGYALRPKYCNFAHDMQASIWRREAYIGSWKNHESPWQWESLSNIRSFDDGWKYYDKESHIPPFAIDYIDYNKGDWSGIRKGKWVKEIVYDLFEREGISVDYSVRGFFEPAVESNNSILRVLLLKMSDIYLYGYKRVIPAVLFDCKRIYIQKLLQKEYYSNYCEYLRHKYYDK